MKAIVIHQADNAQQLQLEERPIPALKEGWTLVKVKGFGINRSEIFTRQGHSPSVVTSSLSWSDLAAVPETYYTAFGSQYHVPVAPEKVFALEDIVAAHQYVESSAGYGKVVVLN